MGARYPSGRSRASAQQIAPRCSERLRLTSEAATASARDVIVGASNKRQENWPPKMALSAVYPGCIRIRGTRDGAASGLTGASTHNYT
jgi:hypothetical protein